MVATLPARARRAVRPSTGGGGGGNGRSNLSYWNGKGGDKDPQYDAIFKDMGNRVLGPRQELIKKFEQHVGVHPLDGSKLVDSKTAGKALKFGDTHVPQFVRDYKDFCKGAKQTYDGDLARKEMQVDLGKHAVNTYVEQHGHDHDFVRHNMSAAVAMSSNGWETKQHYMRCQGELEMLMKQTDQI